LLDPFYLLVQLVEVGVVFGLLNDVGILFLSLQLNVVPRKRL
jgi:hypothetical protein